MNMTCQQCGHTDARAMRLVSNRTTGEAWWLHRGGCVPGSYDEWEPTRRIER